MWVKASGKELSNSLSENIFVPVNINLIRDKIDNQDINFYIDFIVRNIMRIKLRNTDVPL